MEVKINPDSKRYEPFTVGELFNIIEDDWEGYVFVVKWKECPYVLGYQVGDLFINV